MIFTLEIRPHTLNSFNREDGEHDVAMGRRLIGIATEVCTAAVDSLNLARASTPSLYLPLDDQVIIDMNELLESLDKGDSAEIRCSCIALMGTVLALMEPSGLTAPTWDQSCGTEHGARYHYKRGEYPCEECRVASRNYKHSRKKTGDA